MGIEKIKENLLTKQGDDFIDFIDANFVYPEENSSVRIYEIDNNVGKLNDLNGIEKAIVLGKLEKFIHNFKAMNVVIILITIFATIITDYGTIIEVIGNYVLDSASSKILSLTFMIVLTLVLLSTIANLFKKTKKQMLTASYLKVVVEKMK